MINYSHPFAEMHNKNIPQAKFKIGENVYVKKIDRICIVNGINLQEFDSKGNPIIEYSVENYEYLLWEEELSEVEEIK